MLFPKPQKKKKRKKHRESLLQSRESRICYPVSYTHLTLPTT